MQLCGCTQTSSRVDTQTRYAAFTNCLVFCEGSSKEAGSIRPDMQAFFVAR